MRTTFSAVSWHRFSASERLPFTSSDPELWFCGTCGAACSVEVVLKKKQKTKQAQDTVYLRARLTNESARDALFDSPFHFLNTTPWMYQTEQLNTNVNRMVTRQYAPYLEPFVGFPGRRLLEVSPSSLGLNPGGPPSWNERADCSCTGCAGAAYSRFETSIATLCGCATAVF